MSWSRCNERQRKPRRVPGVVFLSLLALAAYGRVAQAAEDDLKVLSSEDSPGTMLYRALEDQVHERLKTRREEVARLQTPEEIHKRQARIRAAFFNALGELPERTPLNATVVGRDQRDGYSVERVIYESRPGHQITANLYLPEGKGPFPGVLVPCGHSANGKAAPPYQSICISLAKNGMAALCYDPIGQGERNQVLNPQGKPLIPSSTVEHNMVGIGALLVGQSTATYRIWDGFRSMDYLASRPEIDPERLGCTGNSGGGTMTAYLMALDDRIAAAAPSCYIASLDRLFATIGPQDAEQDITGQVDFGMDHADYATLRAPKPTLLCVGTQDFFDIQGSWDTFREVNLIYCKLGHGERVSMFESDEKHGFTKPRRTASMRWLRRWLLNKDDAPDEPEFSVAPDAKLQCTETGQVLTSFKGSKSAFDLNADRADVLAPRRTEYRSKHGKDERLAKVRELIGLRGPVKPARSTIGRESDLDTASVLKLRFETEPGIIVPARLISPDRAAEHSPLVVLVGAGVGSEIEKGGLVDSELKAGHRVLVADLRGMGETTPDHRPGYYGHDERESFLGLHLNRPLLGQRVGDLLSVIAALNADQLHGIDTGVRDGIHVIGVGTAGPIALHAAALEPSITALTLDSSLNSWDDITRTSHSLNQLSNAVPNVLAFYDLPDLAVMLAPRALTIRGAVDPAGYPLTQKRIETTYAACKDAYREKGAEDRLSLLSRPPQAARRPTHSTVDLSVGETRKVELSDGKTATVKLISVDERHDPIRAAIREAKVSVEVNGKPIMLSSGNYNLPKVVGGVQVDCPITGGYRANSGSDPWGLRQDARIRIWPAGSTWISATRFMYPARQRWFASNTQMANEPVHVDGGEKPTSTRIYYHYGLDIGGAEGMVEVVAATDGVVVSAGTKAMEGFKDTPARPRYDVVYVLDDQGWYYRYSHLQSIDPAIKPGATVLMGQKIGVLGKEGGSGGWSHLHFDITSRQPSGRWGIQEGYAFLWQAALREQRPEIIAVARPHRLTWTGEPVVLDASKSWTRSGPIAKYEWTFSDGTTAEGARVEKTYDEPGSYSEIVKVTDRKGQSSYDFEVVQVLDRSHPEHLPPTIHAAYAPTRGIKAGDPVTFKVRTFRTTDGEETWDFGDGSPAVTVHSDGNVNQHARDGYAVTEHRYEKPGSYLVRVERTDRQGAKATARLNVIVEGD